MILPILSGVISIFKAPVSWLIFAINLLVFIYTSLLGQSLQISMEKFTRDELFSRTQGYIFAHFIEGQPSRYPAQMQDLAKMSLKSTSPERRTLMGHLAMRDNLFISEAEDFKMSGDEVAVEWWRKKFVEMKEVRAMHSSHWFGLTTDFDSVGQMITYQFMHSGFSHFMGNMFFFLIFATQLEMIIGGLGLLLTYLISGVFAALVFLYFNESSSVPLIGASGAISGVMALLCTLLWRKNIRYLYFLCVPQRGYMGIIYLPAWITLVMWFIADLAGQWATPEQLGGIAYSAHLGGELCGFLMAAILLLFRKLCGHNKDVSELNVELRHIDTKPLFTKFVFK